MSKTEKAFENIFGEPLADFPSLDKKIELFGFLDGQSDCKRGVDHVAGKGDSYDRGYSAQYSLEQIRSERS
tara:strand:- start:482 stop:694 length:213 start_codon:yes stop_codon:yes gene_type:complete